MAVCKGYKKDGARCRAIATLTGFCIHHNDQAYRPRRSKRDPPGVDPLISEKRRKLDPGPDRETLYKAGYDDDN